MRKEDKWLFFKSHFATFFIYDSLTSRNSVCVSRLLPKSRPSRARPRPSLTTSPASSLTPATTPSWRTADPSWSPSPGKVRKNRLAYWKMIWLFFVQSLWLNHIVRVLITRPTTTSHHLKCNQHLIWNVHCLKFRPLASEITVLFAIQGNFINKLPNDAWGTIPKNDFRITMRPIELSQRPIGPDHGWC